MERINIIIDTSLKIIKINGFYAYNHTNLNLFTTLDCKILTTINVEIILARPTQILTCNVWNFHEDVTF